MSIVASSKLRLNRVLLLLTLPCIWLFCLGLGTACAQDSESSNPTGPAGDYNGEVTTAGSYDPYTQNAKRAITDLTVPGSNGAYPLAFSRTYNSTGFPGSTAEKCLGDGGNWRHSYLWKISLSDSNSTNVTAFTVAYPDGATVTFRPNRSTAPASEISTYWRGPIGAQDRLEVTNSSLTSSAALKLHLSDGGVVLFETASGKRQATAITDPYGAVTALAYGPNGVTQVTEPGGRWLKFVYTTVSQHVPYPDVNNNYNVYWNLLTQVQAGTGTTVRQTVSYVYTTFGQDTRTGGGGSGEQTNFYTTPYYVLDHVNYDMEASTVGNGVKVQANYTYTQAADSVPVLLTAHDPHYAGAMVDITYSYSAVGNGWVQDELNGSESVSHLASGGGLSPTETRGDHDANNNPIVRNFTYGTAFTAGNQLQWNPNTRQWVQTDASETTSAKLAQLTSSTDFHSSGTSGNTTKLTYYGNHANGLANGLGNLKTVTDALGRVTTYGHEPITGKVSSILLPDNRTRQWTYLGKDGNDQTQPYYLYSTTDERGLVTTYQRHTNTGLVHDIIYPDGTTDHYEYIALPVANPAFYKVSKHVSRLSATTTYTYGESAGGGSGCADLLTSVTRSYIGPNGNTRNEITHFHYDSLDRVDQTTDPLGVSDKFTYDGCHRLLQTTHVFGNTSVTRQYDDLGNCYAVTDELGHTVTTTFDSYRRPTKVTTPVNDGVNGNRYTRFAYDPRGPASNSIATATSHTRAQWSVSWTKSGKGVERICTPNGWQLYDVRGLAITDPGNGSPVGVAQGPGFAVSYVSSFSATGQVLASVDAEGQTTSFTYDNCGRKLTVTDPLGGPYHTTTYTYYGVGEPVGQVSGLPRTGLLKSVQGPGPDASYPPTVTTYYKDYDKNGHLIKVADPANNWNNVTDPADGLPGEVTLLSAFDPLGDLLSQTDGAQSLGQHTTGYTYDQLGRKSTCGYPDGTTEKWTYDASGNVATYTNRAGAICTYQYDGRNRCTYRYWNDGYTHPAGSEYDAAGRTTRVYDPDSDLHFTYDDSGAVRTEQAQLYNQSGALTTSYTHDVDGRVDSLTYPNGDHPTYGYDNQDRCLYTSFGGGPCVQYTYDAARLTLRSFFFGVDTGYAYQNNGRLNYLWHYHGDMAGNHAANASINLEFYGYAPDGRVSWTSRAPDGGQSGSSLEDGRGDCYLYYRDGSLYAAYQNYGYTGGWPGQQSATADSQPDGGHFVAAGGSAPSYAAGFNFDLAGNPTSFAVQGNPIAFSFDGENRLINPQYNANGDTTDALRGWQFSYDAEHRLISAAGPGGQSASFGYDGLGRLVNQWVNGVWRSYYYAGSQRIEERDASTYPVNRYFFDGPGGDQIFLRVDTARGYLWYLHDGLGNTTHLVDTAGNVLERYLYDAWGTPSVYDPAGNLRSGGSLYDNRYLFKSGGGYEWFPTMGLYFCRARWNLPTFGRWLQPDPAGQAGGLNLYAYCENDPVNGVDPSGLSALGTIGGIFKSIIECLDQPLADSIWGDPGQPTAERVVVTGTPLEDQPINYSERKLREGFERLERMLEKNAATNGYNADLNDGHLDDISVTTDRAKSGAIQAANGAIEIATLPFPGEGAIIRSAEGASAKQVEKALVKKAAEAASEKTAKDIARQIERDLGKVARRDFHDTKLSGAGDRTLQQLKDDAKVLYEEHGQTPPKWLQ